jgi:hypothetical protein
VGVESHDHRWKTVPAWSSFPISVALGQLDLPAGDRALLAGQCPSLLEYLQQVPDPRAVTQSVSRVQHGFRWFLAGMRSLVVLIKQSDH